MTPSADKYDGLYTLLDDLCDGSISASNAARLDCLLREDPAARREYLSYLDVHAGLGLLSGKPLASYSDDAIVLLPDGATVEHPVGTAVELPYQPESRIPSPEPPGFPFPSLSTTNYPLPTSFVGSWAFSCMVSAAIMGVAMLGAWAYKITRHQPQVAGTSAPSDARPEMVFVGRITGMVDVKWSDDPRYSPPSGFAYVPLGGKYELVSGLMEITYDSGAKVILEGPCTYEVESTAGGYLALGKLTARVGERGEGRGESAKPQAANQKSPSSFILHPSSLFSVRTPTAIVTDLGTEFGVEVSEEGATESRVFRGSVRVEVVSNEGRGQDVVLRENESARVEGGDEPRITVLGASAKTADFIRGIPKATYKTLDLVDVVAGGDGFSGRRNRSIDPTNGQANAMTPKGPSSKARFVGDGKYHRVEALPLVDGVFIPDGGKDAVQVDSAGNMFAGFPDTCNVTWKHIWAGGVLPVVPPEGDVRVIPAKLDGIDYSSPGHGVLFLHANKGITFDLEAIRRANPGCKPFRFRAVAGNTEMVSKKTGAWMYADVWVLIDGQVRFKRRGMNGYSRAPVLIPIGENDRFLTLAATDGGDDIHSDWTMFGDPRLDLMQVDANEPKDKGGGD